MLICMPPQPPFWRPFLRKTLAHLKPTHPNASTASPEPAMQPIQLVRLYAAFVRDNCMASACFRFGAAAHGAAATQKAKSRTKNRKQVRPILEGQ